MVLAFQEDFRKGLPFMGSSGPRLVGVHLCRGCSECKGVAEGERKREEEVSKGGRRGGGRDEVERHTLFLQYQSQ